MMSGGRNLKHLFRGNNNKLKQYVQWSTICASQRNPVSILHILFKGRN
jgi:hypothetical protein